ncbi:MAG: MCE family protein, partial [Thermocrispum sp.]
VYAGGPRLADGAVIPVEKTVVPVELDELFTSLNELTTALGPDGANSDGALSELLSSTARNLDGNGRELNKTLQALGKAGRTLAGSDEDLFGTVDGLQDFTTMLAANDRQVREFDELLAEIARVFADEREDLSGALRELAGALQDVGTFVKSNRGKIKSNVDKFTDVAKVLAKQRASLAESLEKAPEALTSLLSAYDPDTNTIDSRANLNEFSIGGGT